MAAAYTEKEIGEIAALLKEGLSASRIAGRFSALRGAPVSRSAIIGIVHRNAGLSAIGFANPKGGRAGGRPRKHARHDRPGRRGSAIAGGMTLSEPAALSRYVELVEGASTEAANLPSCGGDAREGRGRPAGAAVHGVPFEPGDVTAGALLKAKKPKTRKTARTLPPAWLAPSAHQKSEAHLYKLPAPPPAKNPGRQPHVAAMRFLDCLFGRCRAPLDLALREDAEADPVGVRPGPNMLCCGLPTSATRSYCAHHHARFHGQRGRGG
ncbi:GcrA cell cycle regulator [Mesorhizobium sp. J8]|uniref:GcrA cell cycle regulator n=1 Tax=Mesorhizobium sp. J8 TaxID=2777475 RepID=UPI00191615B6|nr:GcrA cell cycle regulator [Mesorhizobium sp. J8]BCM18779.1 hypothetical protein MJ8_25510 [Mesorhizobium sp. J8]